MFVCQMAQNGAVVRIGCRNGFQIACIKGILICVTESIEKGYPLLGREQLKLSTLTSFSAHKCLNEVCFLIAIHCANLHDSLADVRLCVPKRRIIHQAASIVSARIAKLN
ncbi:hypothetical protein SE17_13645 [Kouleothrix aurantiaca]|uniref:Uncharacterized protein n=1 Tax=Kouleothrix aurantiaca TaxID=186479 RepID=A0A0P9FI13_9CHLR|nr:hypothetical protein SE17_13645 [Kouleothrix aurantiaca]